jgi:hypothetical protein
VSDGYVHRCVPVASPGGACHLGFPDDCPPEQYCPLTDADLRQGILTATCAPLLAPGADCNMARAGADCGSYPLDACTTNGCEALGGVGDPCTSDAGCWSNRCAGAPPVCDFPTVCN